jgi:hypothetical protein
MHPFTSLFKYIKIARKIEQHICFDAIGRVDTRLQ